MKLRPYQEQAVSAVIDDWNSGLTDVLGVAATGAGKTQMFLEILRRVLTGTEMRALVIAHRAELIDQPVERTATWEGWDIPMGVVMASRNESDCQIIIATIQTLTSEKRLVDVLKYGVIDYLVIDEAHHGNAQTYLALIERLRTVNPGLRHLGVTATPVRADGDGLRRIYQKVSFQITIAALVRQHYLVQPRWLGIATGIDLKGVETRAGDYVQKQLAQRFDTPQGRAIILQSYQEYGAGRRSIAFTASVQGAHDLAAAFNDIGITAAAVDGTTDKETRNAIIERYRAGAIQVLANCQIFTEGFDAPGTSCIMMCRPTKSDSLYIQCMGRGLRPATGMAAQGEDCLILDFMPEDTRNIVLAGDVLGLPKETTRTALKETTEEEPGAVQAGFTFDGEHFDSNGTPLEIIARQLDYLSLSPYVWERRNGWLTLGLGTGTDGIDRILVITPPQEGREAILWGIWREPVGLTVDGKTRWGKWRKGRIASGDMDMLGELGNEKATRWGASILTSKGRSWHREPATDGQLGYLRKLMPADERRQIGGHINKQLAAALITHYQARAALFDVLN